MYMKTRPNNEVAKFWLIAESKTMNCKENVLQIWWTYLQYLWK